MSKLVNELYKATRKLGKTASVLNDIENTRLFYDCKTILQENVQSWSKDVLKYELVDVSGP